MLAAAMDRQYRPDYPALRTKEIGNVNALQDLAGKQLETGNVVRAAERRLEAAGYQPLLTIKCRFRQGRLLLTGHVPSYYHKQLAQEVMRALPGVSRIINRVSVHRHDRPAYVGGFHDHSRLEKRRANSGGHG